MALWLSITSTTTRSWRTDVKPTVPSGRASSLRFRTSKRPWTTWWWPEIAWSDGSPTGALTPVPSTGAPDGERDRDAFHRHLADRERRVRGALGRAQLPRTLPADRHDSRVRPRRSPRARHDSARPGAHRDVRACLRDHLRHGRILGDRPASCLALVDDRTLVSAMGRVHGFGDRRLRVPGVAARHRYRWELRWPPGPGTWAPLSPEP